MADFGSPVAGGQPYNPMQGVNTLSSLVGIQQQQQALQTGQYQQQSAQAQAQSEQALAQQNQMDLNERNAASDVLKNPGKYGGLNPDGSVNASAMLTHIMQVAPKVGPTLVTPVIQMERDTTAFAKESQALNDQQRESAGNILSGLSQGQFKDTGEFLKAFDTAKHTATAPVASLLDHMLDFPEELHQGQPPTVQALQGRATAYARTTQPAAENMPKPGVMDTGPTYQGIVQAPGSGAITSGGAPVLKAPTPGERLPKETRNAAQQNVIYDPLNPNKVGLLGSGEAPAYPGNTPGPPMRPPLAPPTQPAGPTGINAVNPSGPQVAQQTAAASAGGANDEAAYSQIQQAGSQAEKISSLADDVANFAKSVQTGPLSQGAASKWATLTQSLGIADKSPNTWEAKRQILGKMAAQLRIQANVANGASTDAARADVESAYPDPNQMGAPAVQEAARYVKGLAAVSQARLNNADKFRAANNGSSLGVRAVDNQFTQNADPKAFIYDSLQPGAERQEFLKSHFSNPQDLQQFLASRAILRHQGALGGQ